MIRPAVVLLAAGALGAGLAGALYACGTAHRQEGRVEIATESAIIFWDAGSKVQHFIRRATFLTDTPDFGFLVPTPTQPTLGESQDEVFSFLEQLTAPEVVTQDEYLLVPRIGCGRGNKSMTAPAGVHVLEETRVAGHDAAVLEADSASALKDWLTEHGYTTRPDLAAWLEPYVKRGWKITAFKIARDATRQEVATKAVRMSFSTDRPFFPYSEPAEQRDPEKAGLQPRLLRVFFVAERRYAGRLDNGEGWPGQTAWAGDLKEDGLKGLGKLNVPLTLSPTWLTVFDDHSSPRPGTADVSFFPSPSQDEVRRPPVKVFRTHDLSGWVCLGVVLLLIGTPLVFAVRRAWRAARPTGPRPA